MTKTKILNVRLNPEDYESLTSLVKKRGITKTQFISEVIKNNSNIDSNNYHENRDISTARTYGTRLNEAEAKAFSDYANKLGETRSRLVRKLIRELINQPYPDLLYDEQSAVRVVLRYLAGISRNLNQITAAINSGKLSHRSVDNRYLSEIQIHVDNVKTEFLNYLEITRKRLVIQ